MVSLNAHLTRIERAQTSMLYSSVSTDGQVAQLVEHVTENHGVPSSILGGGTMSASRTTARSIRGRGGGREVVSSNGQS